jgi:dTDP-glucose pyrophosphorylase/CBS domain-containing protein
MRGVTGLVDKRLDAAVVRADGSIREVLRALDDGALNVAFLVSDTGQLEGLATDGDVRRALLGGASLDESACGVFNRNFISVGEKDDRASVLELMKSTGLSEVPVVDSDGQLRGLHLLREVVKSETLENWAVVMAGGRGERLRPLTDLIPKPMIRVAGRPILERIVLHLVGFGIRRIFLSVNYKAEIIEKHLGDGSTLGCHIEYLREKKPLGTGGALSLLPAVPSVPLLVLNGDLLTQFDVGRILAFHVRGGHKATVGVHEYVHTVPFGVVGIEGERIVALREKPTQAWQTNAGIYVLEPELLARVPSDVDFPLPALVEECLDRGECVGAFRVEEDWIDVGRHQELRRARGEGENP